MIGCRERFGVFHRVRSGSGPRAAGKATRLWRAAPRGVSGPHEVPAEAQIAIQACFQAHVDGAVSKTVHLPPEVSVARVAELIHRARSLGCKGVAFWRVGAVRSGASGIVEPIPVEEAR